MIPVIAGILVIVFMATIIAFVLEIYDPVSTSTPQTKSIWNIVGAGLLLWPLFSVMACIPPIQPPRSFRNMRRALVLLWLLLGIIAVHLIVGTGIIASVGILIVATFVWLIADIVFIFIAAGTATA